MIKVNLSRINNMISAAALKTQEIYKQICGARHSFQFEILESTTDADFDCFKASVEKCKQKLQHLAKSQSDWLDYMGYLKTVLAKGNQEYGIAAKLLEASLLRRKIAEMERSLEDLSSWADSEIRQLKNVDYYKTSFTAENRRYILDYYLFDGKDVGKLRKKLENLREESQKLNDEIASLNQVTEMEIMTFEEFAAKNFDRE